VNGPGRPPPKERGRPPLHWRRHWYGPVQPDSHPVNPDVFDVLFLEDPTCRSDAVEWEEEE
jgi:hypothetical protein